ncbi:MAG: SH3 domain-containing protein [Rhodocyclaceae bacterium]|nr:SH3 domain-containing protein [Rhodocyclaceae bacterium]MBX3668979.1 SH3 domain-containing protein [Rhodocyclaceae bacterium]
MGRHLVCAALLVAALPCAASDWKSVAEAAVLYDAPSVQAARQYVIARGTPVEVVRSQVGWNKVREPGGKLAWIESRLLADQHMAIVTAPRATAYAQADSGSARVFEAEKDVLLEVLGDSAPAGWARVKHRDGLSGYVRINQLWGL